MRCACRVRQRGAVMLTVFLLMLFLLGFMGFALDFGKLFVVSSELQTAMDSCALAAAQELDGTSSALTRATSAGLTAGNLNGVVFQSANWAGQGQLAAADVTFKDSTYTTTTDSASAKYAQCLHTQSGVQMWLLQAMGAFTGNTTEFPATSSVAAAAVATRASAQSTCPLPAALKPNPGGPPPYGFTAGQWVTLLVSPGTIGGGEMGWANLDGSSSAAETVAEMQGHCGTKMGDTLGTPGAQANVVDVWNYRFGIYRNSGDPAIDHPDYTGYAYTAKNWPAQANAYNGPVPASSPATATSDNFLAKRASFASCDDTGTRLAGANSCASITGLNFASFTTVATPGASASGGFAQYGTSRRIVLVPVVNDSMQVTGFACMLLLQPLSIPLANIQVEYIDDASSLSSPCTTSGLPGGAAGPLVPMLVR